jgi:Rrf2 family protein
MHITARIDYALRSMLVLAAAEPESLTAAALAKADRLPLKYLYSVLVELRNAGFVGAKRGKNPGYSLARPARQITLGDIIRVMDGPLNGVHGVPMEMIRYEGAAAELPRIWLGANAAMLAYLDQITLASMVNNRETAA